MRRKVFALLLSAGLVGLTLAMGTSASPAVGADSDDTAVTLHGSGRFADLEVTVSKTEHLSNEVVHITWSGMKGGSGTTFPANYLQIMQCWGDDPTPDREKCQFGGFVDIKYGGFYAATRQVDYGSLVDPNETIKIQPPALHAYVPFTSVTGVTEPTMPSQFFGGYTTNEQPFGRSTNDGTGEDFFEIQTAREAPGLGCGERVGDGARDCWLVVVPRDATEVNGAPSDRGILDSSPLSESNWDNKLSFRMKFDPVGLSCPIGTAEKRLMGHEEIAEAITRWQPKLCSEAGAIFGYSQVSDDIARAKALDVDPWLDFVSHPIEKSRIPDDRPITYAPVAISALALTFNIDVNPAFRAPDDVEARRGQRIKDLKLNPRLVAKLLTQSYRNATYSAGMPPANPLDILKDPEFKGLNPQFANLKTEQPLVSLMQPLGLTDGNEELWAYVAADKDAVAFINGAADQWGMKVNPRYLKMELDRSDFPRQDLGTLDAGDNSVGGRILVQELDARPFAADMHDVARSSARGDTLARTVWDPNSLPPAFKRDPLQVGGQRSIIGITDVPTAKRYSLPMVALKNASGKYVVPTEASIKAGLAQMKKSDVTGVVLPNPKATDPNAYPLTLVSYAMTSPRQLTAEDATAYSNFVKYAVTKGQVPGIEQGKLPDGYVPLPQKMVDQSLAAATFIAARGGPKSDNPTPPADNPDQGGNGSTGTGGSSVGGSGSSGELPAPVGSPQGVTGPTGTGDQVTTTPAVTVSFKTPDDAAGAQRFILVAALALGLIAAASRPLLWWVGTRTTGRSG